MQGWNYDLKKVPDFTVICGPNASGKSVLLRRIALGVRKEHMLLYLDTMALPKATTKEEIFMPTIERSMKYIMHELDGIKGKNTVVLMDNTDILNDELMARIFAKIRELIRQKRVWKVIVTRNGSKFTVRRLHPKVD